MHKLLDQILEVGSQQEAQGRLEYLCAEAPAALEVLKDDNFDATAGSAREISRAPSNDQHVGAPDSGSQPSINGHPDVPKRTLA